MTFGVILLVGAILFFILMLITLNVGTVMSPIVQTLADVFKNLATILGTALATIIAFYFGMRGLEVRYEKGSKYCYYKTKYNKTPPTIPSTFPADNDARFY